MKIVLPPVHEKLSHLSQVQIEELIREFYISYKSTHLIENYNIDYKSAHLHKILPPEVIESEECKYCGISMWRKRKRKRDLYSGAPYCSECGHFDNDSCNCINCERERVEKVKFYDIIPTDFLGFGPSGTVAKRNLKLLTYRDRLYISSLLAVSDSENYIIYKINKDFWKLAPNVFYQKKILKYLVDLGIIEFVFDKTLSKLIEVKCLDNIPVTLLQFKFIITSDLNAIELHQELTFSPWRAVSRLEATPIWMEIALEECCDFAINHLKRKEINWCPGEIEKQSIQRILQAFSISQFCFVFNKLLENNFAEYEKGALSVLKFIDKLFFCISRYFIASDRDGWGIKNLMPKGLVPSIISEYFYHCAMKAGEDEYLISPGKSNMLSEN